MNTAHDLALKALAELLEKKPATHMGSGQSNATARETREGSDGVAGGKHLDLLRVGQLGPDACPIVRAKFLPGDFLAAFSLNQHAQLCRRFTTPGKDLVEVLVGNPALLCQDCASCGCEVHAPHYGETLYVLQAFRTPSVRLSYVLLETIK